jgi:hypothetical protein
VSKASIGYATGVAKDCSTSDSASDSPNGYTALKGRYTARITSVTSPVVV